MSRRIGIYGGAFNPPTLGHVHVLNAVLDKDLVDEIWVLPSYIHFHGKKMAPYDIRVEMCVRAFNKIDGITVKKVEYAIAELFYGYDGSTFSMLEALRKHQNEDYHLIIGQDNADSIFTWKNGDVLIRNEKFIIVPRPSDNDFTEIMDKPMWYKYEPHVYLTGVPETNLSSTMARKLLYPKLSPMSDILKVIAQSTIDIIGRYNLYNINGK